MFLLTWVKTTYGSTCANYFNTIGTKNKIAESMAKFDEFRYRIAFDFNKISENCPEIVFS